MTEHPTKKLLKKLDKKLPGAAIAIDPILKRLGSTDKAILDLASKLVLESDRKTAKKTGKRRSFSKAVKTAVLVRQQNRCKMCANQLDVVDFHHVNGNRSDNLAANCEALCPNCHAKKTRNRSGVKFS